MRIDGNKYEQLRNPRATSRKTVNRIEKEL